MFMAKQMSQRIESLTIIMFIILREEIVWTFIINKNSSQQEKAIVNIILRNCTPSIRDKSCHSFCMPVIEVKSINLLVTNVGSLTIDDSRITQEQAPEMVPNISTVDISKAKDKYKQEEFEIKKK